MLKLHAIRHLGERVVARQIADSPLGAFALGDVARHIDVALELRIFGGDRRTGHGNRNGLAAGGAQHGLARFGRRIGEVEGAAVRIVDEADQRLVQQLGFLVAEQALRRLVAALDDAVRRGHQHRIAQAVEHGVQIVLGDGGFVQFLPHALERELQIAELIVAHHGERPGVVALADPVGALDQGRDGPRELPGDEPGTHQSQQKQRQGDAGHQASHALDLHSLLALELLANAGQGLLHFGAAHPDLQTADALHRGRHQIRVDGALEHEPVARLEQGVAAAEQHVSVSVQYFDSFDIPLVEQTLGDGCDSRLVARSQCGARASCR